MKNKLLTHEIQLSKKEKGLRQQMEIRQDMQVDHADN
jgi:hypothetical protein